jgi:hypothetical protein
MSTTIRICRHEVLIDEPPALGGAAVDQHCPVLDLFSNPASVHTELVAS